MSPRISSNAPKDAAVRPLPNDETTPPVTKMYFTGANADDPCLDRARQSYEISRTLAKHQPRRRPQSDDQHGKQQHPQRPLEQLHDDPNRRRQHDGYTHHHDPARIVRERVEQRGRRSFTEQREEHRSTKRRSGRGSKQNDLPRAVDPALLAPSCNLNHNFSPGSPVTPSTSTPAPANTPFWVFSPTFRRGNFPSRTRS